MSDITLEEFEAEAHGVPRRQRHAEGASEKKFVWGEGSDKRRVFDEKAPRAGARASSPKAQAWQAEAVRRRLRLDHRARRSTAAASCPAPTSARDRGSRRSTTCPNQGFFGIGLGMVAPDDPRPRHRRRRKDAYLPHAVPRRHRRLPAVQRAGRRLRPRRRCRPRPSATATSGSSTARRCGRRARSTATSARSSAAPTPTCPSTRASPGSSSTCTRPASRCGRCGR